MTEPIDTAALRAKYPKERDNSLGADDIRALCDALDAARLEVGKVRDFWGAELETRTKERDAARAENTKAQEGYRVNNSCLLNAMAEADAMRPVIEAALALVERVPRPGVYRAEGLIEAMDRDKVVTAALVAAVATYQTGEKP
jgi:hypothetical protein